MPERPAIVADRAGATTRAVAVVAAYVAVTGVMTWPFVDYAHLTTATYEGDARLVVWMLAWANHAVLEGVPLMRANIYWPAPLTLQYNEHLLGPSLFSLPWSAAGASPVLAYTATWWLGFVLNGVTAHLWLRRAVRNDLAAFVGSLVFMCSFFVMLHAHGHLQLIWLWPLPLSLLLFERWYTVPSPGRLAGWLAVLILQLLGSGYLALFGIVAHALLLAWLVLGAPDRGPDDPPDRRRWATRLVQLALAAGIVAASVLPLAQSYLGLEAQSGELQSATLGSYLVPPANTLIGRWWVAHVDGRPGSIWGETTLFLGWTALALALTGVVAGVRTRTWRRRTWLYAVLALSGLALSLGPSLTLFGITLPGPFAWVSPLPGFSGVRAPARFAVLVTLGVAGLTALGAERVLTAGRGGRVAVLVLVPTMLGEWFVVDFPTGRPTPLPVPPIYRALLAGEDGAVVSLPDYRGTAAPYLNSDYLLFSTLHWRPIVNGFGRAEPPGHADVVNTMRGFPATAEHISALGVRYVVLHAGRYPDGAATILAAAQSHPWCRLRARIGDDYLFELAPPRGALSDRSPPGSRRATGSAPSGRRGASPARSPSLRRRRCSS